LAALETRARRKDDFLMTLSKPPIMKLGEYYTLAGAANALGLSYWTVYRYVRLSGVPVTMLGNQKLVRLEDLRGLAMPHDSAPRAGTLFEA
jgi:hypothetical protein